ncbi:glycosyltransferase family 4 protein [bacterium]|nr:glycosyltransferase family 4 protein [candidate division CSSED10-310 bacterium]
MRVAVDARRVMSGMSGLGTYTEQVVRGLVSLPGTDRVQWVIYALASNASAWRDLEGQAEIIPVAWPVEDHVRGDYWKHVALPMDLTRRTIDVFHEPAYQIPMRRSTARYVVTVHDLSPFHYPETNTWKYNAYWKWMTRRAVERSDRVIAVSEYVRGELEDMFPMCRGRVDVTLEAAAAVFSPGETDPTVLARWGINGPYFLTTARYEPRKNLARVLDAFRLFRQSVPGEWYLVAAGGFGWKNEHVIRQTATMDAVRNVVFPGHISRHELVHLMRGAYAVVVPSVYEGFGLPVLEAMACGAPVMCSRRAALPEIAGDAAVYFDPLRVESIAEACVRMATQESERRQWMLRSLERSAQFSWRVTAERTLEVYCRAMRG